MSPIKSLKKALSIRYDVVYSVLHALKTTQTKTLKVISFRLLLSVVIHQSLTGSYSKQS